MAKTDLIERLRKRALVVHLAADAGPAADLDATMREAADRIEELERGRTSFESRIDYLECVLRESGHVVGYHPHGTAKEGQG